MLEGMVRVLARRTASRLTVLSTRILAMLGGFNRQHMQGTWLHKAAFVRLT